MVTLLEKYLEQAKKGHFNSVAVSATGAAGYQHHFTGGVADEPQQLASVVELCGRLQASIDNWQLPEPDWSLDASYVYYHGGYYPNGYDFLTWLIVQDMLRIDAGAPAPLKVAFWQGHNPIPNAWIDPVYRPMLKLIGAVEDNSALRREGAAIFLTKAVVDMFNLSMKLPQLRASKLWDLPRDVMTITLREAEHFPERNSNLTAWLVFAKFLRNCGERVVFVRDTSRALDPIEDFETCADASRDLDARMWLYDHAKLNFFVSNGPFMLANFSKAPFLCFVRPEQDYTDYIPNHPLFWKMKMGVDVGGQFPWSSPRQRIIWKEDKFDNIIAAYEWQWRRAA